MSRILPFRPAAAHRLAPRPVLLSRALRRPRAAWALALAAALCAPGLVQAQAAAPATPAAPAASAADPKAVRAEFGLPLQAAQTLLSQGKAPEALAKLVDLLRRASVRPRRRIATRPTKASKTRRLDSKTKRSQVKKLRQVRPSQD